MTKPITKLISLQAITFLHPGTGQNTGAVDLPVQREVHTEFPVYASSGFKGSLREKAESLWGKDDNKVITVFGSSTEQGEDKPAAGSIAISDARILAFPVRSLQGVFQWVTCPMVIKRLMRDAKLVGHDIEALSIEAPNEGSVFTTSSEVSSPLVLEEMVYPCSNNENLIQIASFIKSILGEDSGFDEQRLIYLNDEDFKYHVKYGTQVSARIKLNKRKTTTGDGGNLWYEETLPPETIFYAFALCHKPRSSETLRQPQDVVNCLEELCADSYLQIGGNETVGQGWCSLKITPISKGVAP